MKTNSEIRQETKALMKGNWGAGVGICLLLLLFSCTASIFGSIINILAGENAIVLKLIGELVSSLASILLIYPISFSLMMMFLHFVRNEEKLHVGGLFKGFSKTYYGKSIGLNLLMVIFTFLWSLLFIIPGLIKSLAYSLAPYILADNPELSANEAINQSVEMMKGYKGKLFLMWLGYFGLGMVSIIFFCIPLLWLVPYYHAVLAKFYEEVKAEYNATAC